MKKIILGISFSAVVLGGFAQQNFQVSQYYSASNIVNPALSGINDMTEINVGYRKQWAGFDGSPSTFYISGHKGITKKKTEHSVSMPMHMSHVEEGKSIVKDESKKRLHYGVGGYAYSDKAGQLNRTSLGVSYAAHFKLTEAIKASAGASLGITNFSLDQVTVQQSGDVFFDDLNASNNKQLSVDFNLGFLLYAKNWYFGYSGMQFFGNKILNQDSNADGKLFVHHNILVGYKHELNESLYLMGNVLFKAVTAAPGSFDVNIKAVKNNKYWGGLGVRNQDALIIFLGGQVMNNLNLNYSYDFNSRISDYTSGGHEIVLGIRLGNITAKDNYKW